MSMDVISMTIIIGGAGFQLASLLVLASDISFLSTVVKILIVSLGCPILLILDVTVCSYIGRLNTDQTLTTDTSIKDKGKTNRSNLC